MLDPSILWESLPKHTPRWKATSAPGSILSTEPLSYGRGFIQLFDLVEHGLQH